MRLQTLASVLICTDTTALGILEQLARQSDLHRNELTYAYRAYPSNPYGELDNLKARLALPDFKFFVDKLKLAISDLPVRQAFADLITERENKRRLRRIVMEAALAALGPVSY